MTLTLGILLGLSVVANMLLVRRMWQTLQQEQAHHGFTRTSFYLLWEKVGKKTKMQQQEFANAISRLSQVPDFLLDSAVEKILPDLKDERKGRIGF